MSTNKMEGNEMICNNCKRKIPDEAEFCNFCGRSPYGDDEKYMGFRFFEIYTKFLLPLLVVVWLVECFFAVPKDVGSSEVLAYFIFAGIPCIINAVVNLILYFCFKAKKSFAFSLLFVVYLLLIAIEIYSAFSYRVVHFSEYIIRIVTIIGYALIIKYMHRRRKMFDHGSYAYSKYEAYLNRKS